MANKKIGFIGTGKMGEALIKGILHARLVPPGNIYASDMDVAKLKVLEKELTRSIYAKIIAMLLPIRMYLLLR